MPSFRSAEKQARYVARSLHLVSQGTERNYEQALRGVAAFMKHAAYGDHLRDLTPETARAYLTQRAGEVGQKALDMDRQAMQAVLGEKLQIVQAARPQVLESRAYTPEQAQLVAEAQRAPAALATAIALDAGLRAHELLTLRPIAERAGAVRNEAGRSYRADRFTGRQDTVLYTVHGKGGLVREVALSRDLAQRLEAQRLASPETVYDRGIGYRSQYAIAGGKKWSDSFSKASTRALGWSTGAHGLRHTFAQHRMNTLQGAGYDYPNALEIVSQEMGHFRPEITETYLR